MASPVTSIGVKFSYILVAGIGTTRPPELTSSFFGTIDVVSLVPEKKVWESLGGK